MGVMEMSVGSLWGVQSELWRAEIKPLASDGKSRGFLLACLLEMRGCLKHGWGIGAQRIPQGLVECKCRTAQSYLCWLCVHGTENAETEKSNALLHWEEPWGLTYWETDNVSYKS